MKKLVGAAALGLLVLVAARWSMAAGITTGVPAAAPARVVIDNFTFSAPTVTIHAGTGVTWVNRDDVPHTVMSEDKAFKSPVLDTGDSFTHTFAARGTYSYYCSIHPRMVGKVVVR